MFSWRFVDVIFAVELTKQAQIPASGLGEVAIGSVLIVLREKVIQSAARPTVWLRIA